MLISQGIDWYKVLVVGKSGKFNETIEVSALWSMTLQFVKSANSTPIKLSVQQIMSYPLKRKHKTSWDVLRKTLVKILRELHYYDYWT